MCNERVEHIGKERIRETAPKSYTLESGESLRAYDFLGTAHRIGSGTISKVENTEIRGANNAFANIGFVNFAEWLGGDRAGFD
jgi:hypothetical protein